MTETQQLILIVDDEPDILAAYKTKLERSGFRVLTAENGEKGVEAAIANHPDLILMDVKMPVMDGVEAELKLRKDPKANDIKLVFLTALGEKSHLEIDEEKAKESGALGYIRKGIGLNEFVEEVRKYLAK